MDNQRVNDDLRKRFLAPLPEYYKRRIIFWFDEDREFEDKIDEIELDNAKIVCFTGRNKFEIKKLLGHDDTRSNYLVYCPGEYPQKENDWLMDIRLYSEEFRADLISVWMDEMHIPPAFTMHNMVRMYRKFFQNKDRRAKVAASRQTVDTPAKLHMAVRAAICGAKSGQPGDVLRRVLSAGLDSCENTLYTSLGDFGARQAFLKMVEKATGYSEQEADLEHLACHILLTACTRTMPQANFDGLERFLSVASQHQAWCFDFVSDWLHSDDKRKLYDIARHVEEKLYLHDRFMKMKVSELADTECFPCIDECILEKLMQDIAHDIIDVEAITAVVEKRRTCVWYDETAIFYEGIAQTANMQRFYLDHAAGFHTVEAPKVWKEYTSDYYQMDAYYRRYHLSYAESRRTYKEPLNELFKEVTDQVERLYVHWFLDKLGENWSCAVQDDLSEYGKIQGVSSQTDFYNDKVRTAESNIVVIISDGLRYEVAANLAEVLRREMQSKVQLTAMQGIFPTTTEYGMAALLPHSKLTVKEKTNGTLGILADDMPTDSGYRDSVLKAANPASIALQYRDVVGMGREQLRALINGMEVIYIYHDRVDKAGHEPDSAIFEACDSAIAELTNLVRIIINRMNRTHILITADHGFLYTFSPLDESDKVDKTSFDQMDVVCGRRYAIMREGAQPDYFMPVRFFDEEAGLAAFAPRENLRIKMKGGALNYVHGGISLQEMCVPVISYYHLRNTSKEYQRHRSKYDTKPVTLSLLSAGRKISNMIFSLSFYQKEAVSDNRAARTYLLYFMDENGKQISDVQKIIADKTSENNQDRTFRRSFNLKQLKYSNTRDYYLMIADEQGLLMPQKEQFRIDIACAIDEFDFFS